MTGIDTSSSHSLGETTAATGREFTRRTATDELAERFRQEAATDRLFEEVAFVAYYFGWSHETVLNMPHWERRRWCEEISRINERTNGGRER